LSCRSLKDLGHCVNKQVQQECPQSCGTCQSDTDKDTCQDADGTATPWGLSCTDLASHCSVEDVQHACPDSCGLCR
jgi:hypothetical protein